MTYVQELQDEIRSLHGVESEHVGSVPVKEIFQGTTVWNGVVEIFDLKHHPTAFRVYAWAHDTDDRANPRRHVTVLQTNPIKSARDAVRAAITQEFKSLGTISEK